MLSTTLMLIMLFIFSCGINSPVSSTPIDPETGFIRALSVENNRLSFTTMENTFVSINYQNRNNSIDRFRGWTAGEATTTHRYQLPVSRAVINYQVNMRVYSSANVFVRDTTFTFTSTAPTYSHLKVHFINVQQGDAILIQTPDGKNVQIDGGYGSFSRDREAWTGAGETIALNYLMRNNVTHLDYLIETHRHQDHWGGLQDITRSSITHGRYVSVSNPQGYTRNSRLRLSSPVEFIFYNIGFPPNISENLNNSSIVLKMTYGNAEFLFTGDAEGALQSWLVDQRLNLSSNVFLVSHHGASSNSTTTPAFLNRVLNQFASVAILSYGTNNPYNHPRDLSRFNRFQTFGTNPVSSPPSGNNFHFNCGTIIVWSDGRMVFVSTER